MAVTPLGVAVGWQPPCLASLRDAFGRLGFLVLYVAGGLAATVTRTVITHAVSLYLGAWFLYQFLEARYALLNPEEGGSGVAFAAHVGGFLFGMLAAYVLASAGRIRTHETRSALSPS